MDAIPGTTAAGQAAIAALRIAGDALRSLADRPGDDVERALALVLTAPGRVVVTGLGKSGLVGAKIAATLSSTGTPAAFVHAADALHGDSGAVQAGDVVLAISNSGETEEVCRFAAMVREQGAMVVALSGCGGLSRLAGCADVVLDARVDRECDPEGLVPTASTTVALALGDALAVGLMVARGFGAEEFRRYHPGGTLGRQLAASAEGSDTSERGERIGGLT